MSRILPLLFALYPLVLAAIVFWWLLRARPGGRAGWSVRALASGSMIAFLVLTGPWSYTSHYLRYVVPGLFVVALVVSYRWTKRQVGVEVPGGRATAASVAVLALFGGLCAWGVASRFQRAAPLDLAFPLASGTYCVLQGGNGLVTNPFHTLSGNRLALDVVKLNALGNRASGLFPRALDAYEIYGETLYGPCAGRVAELRDDLPDNPPGDPDPDHPEGNFIVLTCAEGEVLLGHLRQGSLGVARGDRVAVGQPIAEVGNSGNTLEPHLHLEARNERGEMRPRFDGRSLSVNSLVRRR